MKTPYSPIAGALLALILSACGGKDEHSSTEVALPGVQTETVSVALPNTEGSQGLRDDSPRVILQTERGPIVIALFTDKAPETTRRFTANVKSGYYDNTVFHRVIANLLIQGGAYTPQYQRKPEQSFIRNEAANGLRNLRGTVAAARRANDSESAGTQFFINVVDNPQFDYTGNDDARTRGYTVFGAVVEGMDIVDGIRNEAVSTKSGVGEYTPKTPVVILTARLQESK